MITPLPPGPFTHVCVICYTKKGHKVPAKWVNHRGHALCHGCREYTTHHLVVGGKR
jgi:hypothetical protein